MVVVILPSRRHDYFSYLPHEALKWICIYAGNESTLPSLPLNRRLHQFQVAQLHRQFYADIEITRLEQVFQLAETLSRHDNYRKWIQTIHIDLSSNEPALEDINRTQLLHALDVIWTDLANLEEVHIIDTPFAVEAFLQSRISEWAPNLKEVSLVSDFRDFHDPLAASHFLRLSLCNNLSVLRINVKPSRSSCSPTIPTSTSIDFDHCLFPQLDELYLQGPLSSSCATVKFLTSSRPSRLSLFDTNSPPDLARLLSSIENSSELKELYLDGHPNHTRSINQVTLDVGKELSRFTSLLLLDLNGSAFQSGRHFYNYLRPLPLRMIRFGPTAKVTIDDLERFVSPINRHTKILDIVVNNVFGRSGTLIEVGGRQHDGTPLLRHNWTMPQWTSDFTKEDLRTVVDFAKSIGVTLSGSAVDSIDFEDTFSRAWSLSQSSCKDTEEAMDVDVDLSDSESE